MIITKKYNIHDLIVKPENVEQIINKIEEEYKNEINAVEEKDKNYITKKYLLRSKDGTLYEAKEVEEIYKGSILSTRNIQLIKISFMNLLSNKSIEIYLRHSINKDDMNEITVSGNDENWVYGVITKIEEITKSMKRQNNWIDEYYWRILILFTLGISFLITKILFYVISILIKENILNVKLNLPLNIGYELLISLFIGFFIIVQFIQPILNKMRELFPNVELQLGNEYQLVEENRRKKVKKFIWEILTPILIGIALKIIIG